VNLAALRELAESLPPGTAVLVPREWLLELLQATNGAPQANGTGSDRMLTAEEAGQLLGTPERWVYNHANQLGVRRLSRRCVRFPESAVRRYLERQR
jgi:predicted DNA-binding transcriptional regulator AlpA